jgi:hypothetical protein
MAVEANCDLLNQTGNYHTVSGKYISLIRGALQIHHSGSWRCQTICGSAVAWEQLLEWTTFGLGGDRAYHQTASAARIMLLEEFP